jgi:hypothetical protein
MAAATARTISGVSNAGVPAPLALALWRTPAVRFEAEAPSLAACSGPKVCATS